MKKLKIIAVILLLLFICLPLGTNNITTVYADEDTRNKITDTIYRTIDGVLQDKTTDTPEYFRFNRNAGDKYTMFGDYKFYETFYLGKYSVYSLLDPNSTKDYALDYDHYMYVLENKIDSTTRNGWHLLDSSWSRNFKTRSVPDENLLSQESNGIYRTEPGHMKVQPTASSKYAGQMGEWRYIGYAPDGTAIPNPLFPPDSLTLSKDGRIYTTPVEGATIISQKTWEADLIVEPWKIQNGQFFAPTEFVPDNMMGNEEVLKSWFENYLFANYPNYLTRALNEIDQETRQKYTRDTAWKYWSERLMWHTNPDLTVGILSGWIDSGGQLFYRWITFETPPKPNMRMVNLTIVDKETNEIVAMASRPGCRKCL